LRTGKPESKVDAVLLESIDSALEVLGTAVKESLLDYLMKEHSISRQEIPKDVEQFTLALRHILGYGSKVIEKIVIRTLVEKCNIPEADAKGKSLAEIIEIAYVRDFTALKHAAPHSAEAALDELDFEHQRARNRRLGSGI
jgi:hypothetical protein